MDTSTNSSPKATFQDFGLAPEIQQTLSKCGFERPTEIQEKAIPLLLGSQKIDFHGQAQTGTGKTLAFGIPLLHRINKAERRVQALVIVPTRELAVQICDSLKPLASSIGVTLEAIYGGASIEVQLQKLRRGIHIVVGTPGRILDHLQRGSLHAEHAQTLVLDEADIMLDMGFKEDIDLILDELPESREIWLFSATVKSGIYAILKSHMKNHTSVRVNSADVATTTTKHYFCVTTQHNKLAALCRFIESNPDFYGFIFCQTKILASQIAEQLLVRGYKVGALHGDLSQAQRNIIIKRFRAKDLNIVVATDVAARGIDVAHLTHVINYSLPDDQESYIHRAGRTGRAGRDGIAITFINKHEMRSIRDMQRKFNIEIEPINVPDHTAIMNVRLGTIGSYLTELHERKANTTCDEVISALSDEACRKTLGHVLYDMFLKQVDDRENFVQTPSLDSSSNYDSKNYDGKSADAVAEISINVGSDDGATREDIVALFESKDIVLDTITKIRVLKRCTFVHTSPDKIHEYLKLLQGASVKGRPARATQVTSMPERGGGSRRHEHRSRSHNNNRFEHKRGGGHHHGGGHGGHAPYGGKRRDRRFAQKPEFYQAHAKSRDYSQAS